MPDLTPIISNRPPTNEDKGEHLLFWILKNDSGYPQIVYMFYCIDKNNCKWIEYVRNNKELIMENKNIKCDFCDNKNVITIKEGNKINYYCSEHFPKKIKSDGKITFVTQE